MTPDEYQALKRGSQHSADAELPRSLARIHPWNDPATFLSALEHAESLHRLPMPLVGPPSPTPEQRALTRAWRVAEQVAEAQGLELHSDAGGFPVLVALRSVHPVRPEESPVPGQAKGRVEFAEVTKGEHECDANSGDWRVTVALARRSMGDTSAAWKLWIDTEWAEITFCPFCGKRLPT